MNMSLTFTQKTFIEHLSMCNSIDYQSFQIFGVQRASRINYFLEVIQVFKYYSKLFRTNRDYGRRKLAPQLWEQAARTAMRNPWGPRAAVELLLPSGSRVVSYVGEWRGPEGCFCAGACRLTLPGKKPSSLFAFGNGECGRVLSCCADVSGGDWVG